MSLMATIARIEAQQKRIGIAPTEDGEHQHVHTIKIVEIPSGKYIDQDRLYVDRYAGHFRLPATDAPYLPLMDAPEMPDEFKTMGPAVEDTPRSEPNPAPSIASKTIGLSAADRASIAQIEALQRTMDAETPTPAPAPAKPASLRDTAAKIIAEAKARRYPAYDPNNPFALTR